MYLEFETQIHLQTFCRNLSHKRRKDVNFLFTLFICRLKRSAKRKCNSVVLSSSDYSKKFETSFSTSLFSVFFRCLYQLVLHLNWLRTSRIRFFSMGHNIVKNIV